MDRSTRAACVILSLVGCSTERAREPKVRQEQLAYPLCKGADRTGCMYVPTQDDMAQLREAAKDCGLHKQTLKFGQDRPFEYDIQIDRSFGDTEEGIDCALTRVPSDFHEKFGIGPIIVTVPEETSKD
jgi:hypothetical protein